jgi:hypothetical protein
VEVAVGGEIDQLRARHHRQVANVMVSHQSLCLGE